MVSCPASTDTASAARPEAAPMRWQLGSLTVSCGPQPVCAAPSHGALLLIPIGQSLDLLQENQPRILHPTVDLLYLPEGESGLLTAPFRGWRLELEVQALCLLAAELADHRLSPTRFRRHLQKGQPLQLRFGREQALVGALLQLLELGSSTLLRQQGDLQPLELDRVMLRLVVLLLCGDLIRAAASHAGLEPGHRTRVFDDLLRWIQAHLDQPMQLQDLVRQSGYSERSLRNFFHARFGCGPLQWIRGQRLASARERLLDPQPQDTVGGIAAALGYTHASQFSRDFQLVFGSLPSQVLREGRRASRLGGACRSVLSRHGRTPGSPGDS